MKILSQVNEVRKAVKNVRRMREIVGAMSRFGFHAAVARLGLQSFAPRSRGSSDRSEQSLPLRLRLLLEELGPTFIKFGQILGGRPDLISAEIVDELKKLQDQVSPVSILLIKPLLEQSLGRKLEECYASFDTEAMATASIAQVHAARTLDGDDVVVKIRKPGVERLLHQDLEILELISRLAEKSFPELRSFHPVDVVREFKRSLLAEIDFTREVNNIKRYRENFAENPFLVVPKPYLDLCTVEVITMERVRGVKLSDEAAVRALGISPRDMLSRGLDTFLQSLMVDGLFHSDPHGGNILVLPDGRMALIDFGSVGVLSEKSRRSLIGMFLALVAADYDWLVVEYVNMSPGQGGSRNSNTIERLQKEVNTIFAPYHGLPLREIPAAKLLMEATAMALRQQVQVPQEMLMVFRSIMTLEGMARKLDPEFDLVGHGGRFAKSILWKIYKPETLLKDLVFSGRDYLRFLQAAPRQGHEILRQIETGELKVNFHVSNVDAFVRGQLRASSKIGLSLLSLGFLLSATWLSSPQQASPLWAMVTLWAIAASLCTLSLFRMLR